MVRVITLSGEEILSCENDALTFDQLLKEVTEAMQVPYCKLILPDGVALSPDMSLSSLDEVTAIAVSLDPLLQMLGFQDDTGPLLKVPREEMERMALQFGSKIVSSACRHGGPGHLEGFLRIRWPFPDVPPPPSFAGRSYIELNYKLSLLPAGTRVTTCRDPTTLGHVEEKTTILSSDMKLKDLLQLRRDAKLEPSDAKVLLQSEEAKSMKADSVHRTIRLKSYEAGEVQLIFHHEFWQDEDFY